MSINLATDTVVNAEAYEASKAALASDGDAVLVKFGQPFPSDAARELFLLRLERLAARSQSGDFLLLLPDVKSIDIDQTDLRRELVP